MSPTPPPDDAGWMAYLDGELDAAARADFERALAADPTLAARVQAGRALRARVAAAHADVLAEPVPARLLALLQEPEATPRPPAPVVDLAAARTARRPGWTGGWTHGWPSGWALAAGLLVGLLGGALGWQTLADGPFGTRDGRLLARGSLDRALTTQLASAPAADAAVAVQLSFQSRDGRYCRSFTLRDGAALAGLACRDGPAWQIEMLAHVEPATATHGLRPAASGIAPEVLRAIEARLQGDPLDAAAERQARDAHWRR